MPMMGIWFRFPEGSVPSEAEVRDRLTTVLGRRAARGIDELSFEGSRMTLTSMSRIVIIYAWRIGEELGGAREYRGSRTSPPPLPEWVQKPWPSYGLLERLRIRLGRIAF